MDNLRPGKILILDGIGGVPLGRELQASLTGLGVTAVHVSCLSQTKRPLHRVRSAIAKAINRYEGQQEYFFLPSLNEDDLVGLLEREQPDFILVVGFIYKFFDPARLKKLAEKFGASLLLYDTDSCNLYSRRREFIFFVENELPVYDIVFSFSEVTTRFFRDSRGLNAQFMPFGASPQEAWPQDDASEKEPIDVLFVGTCDLRRIILLERIAPHVTVYGQRWLRNAPLMSKQLSARARDQAIWGDELRATHARTKILLNITRSDFFGAETGINLRIFEALAAGCFLMTDHCEELDRLFRVGEELVSYTSSADLAEKVEYFLHDEPAREAIARRGHASFLSSHTWDARMTNIFLPALVGKA